MHPEQRSHWLATRSGAPVPLKANETPGGVSNPLVPRTPRVENASATPRKPCPWGSRRGEHSLGFFWPSSRRVGHLTPPRAFFRLNTTRPTEPNDVVLCWRGDSRTAAAGGQ